MRPRTFFFLLAFFVLLMGIFCPVYGQAQFWGPWALGFSPFYPWYYRTPFPLYHLGYLGPFGLPVLSPRTASPYLIEPGLRLANAPVTLSIPTVSTTTPPLTAILNLLDPAVLASNIAVLSANFPLVFDLLVTTFQLPLL